MSTYDVKTPATHVEKQTSLSADSADFNEDLAAQGAQIEDSERELGAWDVVKLHPRAVLCCAVAFTAPACVAYDNIANGATLAMPAFFLYFGDIGPTGPYLPSNWISLWGAMSSLAQAVGASTVGFVSDRFGRKWPAFGAAFITIIGTFVQFFAASRGMLLAGKIINGFGLGALLSVATTYASEIAPIRLRGTIQSALVLFSIISFTLALTIVRFLVPDIRPFSFKLVFALQWVVGGLAAICFAFTTESPAWLVAKKKLDRAQKAMAHLYGTQGCEARTANLIKTIREEQAQNELQAGSYWECFKGTNLKRTMTACVLYAASNVDGAPLLGQNILVLIIAGLPAIHAFDINIGGFALAFFIILATWTIQNKISRRSLYLFGSYLNVAMMLIIGAMYYVNSAGGLWAAAVLMNLLITFQTSFIQSSGYPIAAEVSSLRLRQKTLSIALTSQTVIAWLLSFVVPYMYNVDSGNLGLRTGFVFFGFSLLFTILSFFLVPDTTNLTPVEIDHAYENKVSPRHFQKFARHTSSAGVA